MKKTSWQHLKDFVGMPLRLVILSDTASRRWGFTSLEDERLLGVMPRIRGRLLDIGAGNNHLVRAYGNGVGVDVYDQEGDALIVADSANLPFEDASFDTITFMASLNHIPYREQVLDEARRLLQEDGKVIVTMIGPLLGSIGHKLWWYSEEKERGMMPGEVYGLSPRSVQEMAEASGFRVIRHSRFVYGLNNLYELAKATPDRATADPSCRKEIP